jgi:uncharacterized protein (TIRG00374 family)
MNHTTHSHATAGSQRRSPSWLWAVKLAVSAGLLYVLLRRVDTAQLWQTARSASFIWFAGALALNLVVTCLATWRWRLLLQAQHIPLAFKPLLGSYLVAAFFNNFLPSNIGGDVVRIRDTARPAGSKTLATTIVLVDRGLGLMGLVFVAALGATMAARMSATLGPIGPGILWAVLAGSITMAGVAVLLPQGIAALLRPLRALHQEWVEERITRLTAALARFRDEPQVLGACFAGAILVQGMLVGFFALVAAGLHLNIPLTHLGIVVPLSFIVQMLPVSLNGFGLREATFVFYFTRLGLPGEAGFALSFIAAVLMMVFSLIGAVTYLARRR